MGVDSISNANDGATISSSINEYYGADQEAVEQNDRLELVRSITSGNSRDVLDRLET